MRDLQLVQNNNIFLKTEVWATSQMPSLYSMMYRMNVQGIREIVPLWQKTFISKICTHASYFCLQIKRNRCSTYITQPRTSTDFAASTFPHGLHPLFLQPALQTCYPLQTAAVLLKTWMNTGEFPSDFTVLTFNCDNGHTPAGILTYFSVSINSDKGSHHHTEVTYISVLPQSI